MRIFISGGCKNGKSTLAQQLAVSQAGIDGLYYIATMKPTDKEDLTRISRHQEERRGMGFTTLEYERDLPTRLSALPRGASLLLDSITALLANEMFGTGTLDDNAGERTSSQIKWLCDTFDNILLVSDYIYSEPMRFTDYSALYAKSLAMADRTAAALCDTVIECAYGNRIVHKGSTPAGV